MSGPAQGARRQHRGLRGLGAAPPSDWRSAARLGCCARPAAGRRMAAGDAAARVLLCGRCGAPAGPAGATRGRRASAPAHRIPPGADPCRKDSGANGPATPRRRGGARPRAWIAAGARGAPPDPCSMGRSRPPRPPAARFWISRFPACFAPRAHRLPGRPWHPSTAREQARPEALRGRCRRCTGPPTGKAAVLRATRTRFQRSTNAALIDVYYLSVTPCPCR